MRLLLDEHISPDVAAGMRARGHDAVSVIEIGLRTCDDAAIWHFAMADGRAIVTYNADDFVALAVAAFQDGVHHSGLVLVSPRTIAPADIGGLTRSLVQLIERSVDLCDQVVYLRRRS